MASCSTPPTAVIVLEAMELGWMGWSGDGLILVDGVGGVDGADSDGLRTFERKIKSPWLILS